MNNELTLKERIQEYLYKWKVKDPNHWVNGGEVERLAQEIGFKASNASRRCRELVDEQILDRRENEKGYVEYQFKF